MQYIHINLLTVGAIQSQLLYVLLNCAINSNCILILCLFTISNPSQVSQLFMTTTIQPLKSYLIDLSTSSCYLLFNVQSFYLKPWFRGTSIAVTIPMDDHTTVHKYFVLLQSIQNKSTSDLRTKTGFDVAPWCHLILNGVYI